MAGTRSRKLPEGYEPEIYIKGYFHNLFMRGERPDYSVPYSPLPKIRKGASIKVESLFDIARRNGAKKAKK